MKLIEELNVAVTHLKTANQLARDYRTREAVANAILIIDCANHIEKRIAEKTEKLQAEPPSLSHRD